MDVEVKVKEYEDFLEKKLKNDLNDIQKLLEKKSNTLKEWETLLDTTGHIQKYKIKDTDMHVNFNLGNGINCFANICDYDLFYIDLGLGCLLEMTSEEVLKYADIRLKLLKKEIQHLRKLAINVKVHMKLMLLAINELRSTKMD